MGTFVNKSKVLISTLLLAAIGLARKTNCGDPGRGDARLKYHLRCTCAEAECDKPRYVGNYDGKVHGAAACYDCARIWIDVAASDPIKPSSRLRVTNAAIRRLRRSKRFFFVRRVRPYT